MKIHVFNLNIDCDSESGQSKLFRCVNLQQFEELLQVLLTKSQRRMYRGTYRTFIISPKRLHMAIDKFAGGKRQMESQIREAYIFLREKNHSIPSDTLEFMYQSSLQALNANGISPSTVTEMIEALRALTPMTSSWKKQNKDTLGYKWAKNIESVLSKADKELKK